MLNRAILRVVIYSYIILLSPYTVGDSNDVELRIHCWEGYAKPYTEGFKQYIKEKYSLNIDLHITHSSDPKEFWDYARAKQADLISPAHNILKNDKWPFIKHQIAIPIDLTRIQNYKNIYPFLQMNDFVTSKEHVYGVPFTMGMYSLAYNADKVEKPDSWNVLWSEEAKNHYTISKDYSDANIYITALALGANYEALYNIDTLFNNVNTKELQQRLYTLANNAYSLWEGIANVDEFNKLHYVVSWGYGVNRAIQKGLNWKIASPKEGTTLWVDHWVITYATHNNPLKKQMAEEWINYTLTPQVQADIAKNWGVTPTISELDANNLQGLNLSHIGDEKYWRSRSLWENQTRRTSNGYSWLWKQALQHRKSEQNTDTK